MTGGASLDAGKKALAVFAVIVVAALVLGVAGLLISRIFPRHDPAPASAAHKDTVKARDTGEAIGTATTEQNRESTVRVDITTKEISDAFQSIPIAAPPPAGASPNRDLPPAPVDRLRDTLNAGISRANRAADASGTPERTDQD